jgi:hypothetical protein
MQAHSRKLSDAECAVKPVLEGESSLRRKAKSNNLTALPPEKTPGEYAPAFFLGGTPQHLTMAPLGARRYGIH